MKKTIYKVRMQCIIVPSEYGGITDIYQYVFNEEDLDLLLKAEPNISYYPDVEVIEIEV